MHSFEEVMVWLSKVQNQSRCTEFPSMQQGGSAAASVASATTAARHLWKSAWAVWMKLMSPMENVNNHASKMERSVPKSSREGFKLLLGGTYWDLDLDTSDVWVNLHFSSHACVWRNNVGGRPVSLVMWFHQTWPCFSRKKKKLPLSF